MTLGAISTADLSQTVILNMSAGSAHALSAGQLLIDTTTANADHLVVGNTVHVRFALTGRTTLRIGGIYQANALVGSYLVSSAYFLRHFEAAAHTANTDVRRYVETELPRLHDGQKKVEALATKIGSGQ